MQPLGNPAKLENRKVQTEIIRVFLVISPLRIPNPRPISAALNIYQ
jgi:hypothetical protein